MTDLINETTASAVSTNSDSALDNADLPGTTIPNDNPVIVENDSLPEDPALVESGTATLPALELPVVETVTATIDGREVEVPYGTSILDAAKLADIKIPTLCHHPDLPDVGICRVCVCEVEGQWALQAACAYPITKPTTIRTYSSRVRQARQTVVDLMLAEHYGDCRTCGRAGNCELQDLATEYASEWNKFGTKTAPDCPVDFFGPSIVRDMNKCVLCTRCVRTCAELQGVDVLGVVGRGDNTAISSYQMLPLSQVSCINCGQCAKHCPTGALREFDESEVVWRALEDPTKHVVIQTAPAPRVAIGEEFGLEPGTAMTWQLNSALREIGFDKVFDTNFSADLTILEEGTELIERLYENLVLGDSSRPLPQFTSCSPGWIKYLEHKFPETLDNLSSCKSPQQMFGALIKTFYAEQAGIAPENIVSVSLMPCTAKKFEAARPEMTDSGFRDVDASLTTREMAKMMRQFGIHLPEMPDGEFDDPFGTASGSGVIFGATGGVMESAIRTVIELVTGKPVESIFEGGNVIPVRGFDGVRYAEITLPDEVGPVPELLASKVPNWDWLRGVTLKVAVVHGTGNARKVMEDIAAGGVFAGCHFIEFMACPTGCIGGGGQPIPTNQAIRAARAKALYEEDLKYGNSGRVRKSHENPAVARIYSEYLTDGPGGHRSHKLLHTTYTPRSAYLNVPAAEMAPATADATAPACGYVPVGGR